MSKTLVVLPTYNEIQNIELVLNSVFSLSAPFDVLVVDDSSPDGTAQKVEELKETQYPNHLFLLVRDKKNGLGKAYVEGFAWALNAGYDKVCQMDADFSHSPQDLLNLRQACEDGADFAIGSRYLTGFNVVNWPLDRILLSYGASKYANFMLGLRISDCTSGFSCIKSSVLQAIDFSNLRSNGYVFQIELKYRAKQKKFKLREISIIFKDRERGESKMNSSIVWEAFFYVLRLGINRCLSAFKSSN